MGDDNQTNTSPTIFSFPTVTTVPSGQAGHDYVLQKVTLASEYSMLRPGRSLAPRIIVYNQGGDDTAPGNVPVEAWLGDTLLIPVTGEFLPLKGGTSGMYTLRYMIPHDIPKLSYHLTLKIDPWETRHEAGDGTNDMTTQSLVIIEDVEWDKI